MARWYAADLRVAGDLILQGVAKAYRLRRSGGALDFDYAGQPLYLGGYPAADFTGPQNVALVANTNGVIDFQIPPLVPAPTAPGNPVRNDDSRLGAAQAIVAATVTGSVTYNPDASASSRFNLTIEGQNVVLGVPTGGADQQVIHLMLSGATSTRTVQLAPTLWGGADVPTHLVLPVGAEAYVRMRRTDLGGTAWIVEEASVLALLNRPMSYLGSGSWGTGTVSTGPLSFPESYQTGDVLYAVLHSRLSTTVLPAITNWTIVYQGVAGSGTDAADAGPTRITIYKRVLGTGAIAVPTQTFAALGTTVVQGVIHGFRPRPDLAVTEEFGTANPGAGLTVAGTTTALTLQPNDFLLGVVGTPSDTADRIDLTLFNISNVAFAEIAKEPNMTSIAIGGNQLSAATFLSKVFSGTAAATGLAFEGHHTTPARTKGVVIMKVRAA